MADPEIVVRGRGDFSRLDSDIRTTESRLGKLGRTAARGLGVGIGIAGAAVVKLGIDSVKAASDAQQSIGATESVFGKYADVVIRRSTDAADAVGLSANEYRELANVTGAMLASAGTPLKKVADLTDQLEHRAADMAATFGGSTAEAVQAVSALLRGETDPIERYGVSIKQSDINARLAAKGLDGLTGSALKQAEQQERLKLLFDQTSKSSGQFARESDTLAGAGQRLSANFEDVEAKVGTLLLPALSDLAEFGSDALDELVEHGDDIKDKFVEVGDAIAPAVDEIREAFGHLVDNGGDLSGMFDDKLIPALRTTSEFVGGLVNFVDELPGPVKDLGIEVGIAAVAFGILAPKVTLAKDTLAKYTTNAGAAAARTAKLKAALSGAAGIGGMVLLQESASTTNDTLSDLMEVGGGALLGFMAGGPIGAAIGGGVGLLHSLAGATENAGEKAKVAGPKYSDFADSLDQVTGSATDATTALARQALSTARVVGNTESAIQLGREMGLSQRTIVQASLGNRDALDAVTKAINRQGRGWHDLVDADGNVIGRTKGLTQSARFLKAELGLTTRQIGKARRETLLAARDTQEWAGKLKGFPKKAATKIELNGVLPTERGIAKVVARYKEIDKKDIKTILEVTGVDATVSQIRHAAAELKAADKKEARLETRIEGATKVRGEIELTRSRLADLDGNRADTYIYTHHVDTYSSQGGGHGAPGAGRILSLLPSTPELEGAGEDAGATLGKALVTGVARARPGRSILSALLAAVVGGSAGVSAAIGKLNKLIEDRTKDDKAGNARQRAILRGLADEYAALKRIGQAHDELNRKLEKAKEHLQEVRQFVDEIRDSFIAAGDVTQLGQLEDGTVSGTLLIDQLRDKVAHAQRFAELIRELTDSQGVKLNQTTLQQLLAQGPEAGLATAEALAAGGDAALQEINNLTGQLGDAGQQLGSDMSDQFFDVGLNASEGLVAGLEAQNEALDRAARRLAHRLAAAVRHALGGAGKGPNGRSLAEGLGGIPLGGIDATTARTTGKQLGAAMLEGFTTPQLGAGAAAGAPFRFEVKLTAEQESRLRRGKSVTLDISAGQARGVRRLAVGGAGG